MNYNEEDYWNARANKVYRYKGEEFYTITPIPYYYQRRKVILDFLAKCVCGGGQKEYVIMDVVTGSISDCLRITFNYKAGTVIRLCGEV